MFTNRSGNFSGIKVRVLMGLAFGCAALTMAKVQSQAQSTAVVASAVPRVVNFNGVLAQSAGKPSAATIGVTFLLYKDQTGGAPLWLETQNVRPDRTGHYAVMLGATIALPSDIFASGEARWLAVQPEGESEQERVLLVAVPYALKAADAETIGGLPPSAFVLAAPGVAPSSTASTPATPSATTSPAPPPVGGTGTANFVPLWLDGAGTLGDSVLFQTGSGTTAKIGVNTTAPATTLDVKGGETVRGILSLPATGVATATAGKNSQPASIIASAFNSGTSTAVNETFRWQAEPTGNNTATTGGSMNLLFGQGSAAPAETGFNIASNGLVHFAPGQTFPGTGAITGVTAGTDLTGGGSSGNVTLNLDTAKVPQLTGDNLFTGNQTFTGILKGITANFTSPDPNVSAQIAVSGIGVFGANNTPGIAVGAGVEGDAAGSLSSGVMGIQTGGGIGVLGTANTSLGGIGVEGSATTGTAILGVATDGNAASFENLSEVRPVVVIQNDTSNGPLMSVISGSNPPVDVLKVNPTQVALGGIASPAVKLGVGTQTPAALLDVVSGTAGTHDPIAQFGSTGTADQNAIKTYNGTGNTEVFIAGKASGFVPGTAAGDGGLRVNPGQKIFFGDSSLARMSIDASGNVKVTGNLSKGGGSFKIDHPLDPLNKYLYHSFVESPDMMNVYNGNIVTDKKGQGIVTLPDYFEALNRDFRYQLTVIGQFAQAIVARKIAHNRFIIKTNRPSVEVSWQITGIRQDPYANAHRIPVEEEKPGAERGSYLHPDAYPVKDKDVRAVAEVPAK